MDSLNRRCSKWVSLASVYRPEIGLVQNAPNASLNPIQLVNKITYEIMCIPIPDYPKPTNLPVPFSVLGLLANAHALNTQSSIIRDWVFVNVDKKRGIIHLVVGGRYARCNLHWLLLHYVPKYKLSNNHCAIELHWAEEQRTVNFPVEMHWFIILASILIGVRQ